MREKVLCIGKEAKKRISTVFILLGLSPTTRALGAFSLYPVLTPDPYANSLRLSAHDEFLIIGSKSIWEFISYDQAVKASAKFVLFSGVL